jgi:hypothetical protein
MIEFRRCREVDMKDDMVKLKPDLSDRNFSKKWRHMLSLILDVFFFRGLLRPGVGEWNSLLGRRHFFVTRCEVLFVSRRCSLDRLGD